MFILNVRFGANSYSYKNKNRTSHSPLVIFIKVHHTATLRLFSWGLLATHFRLGGMPNSMWARKQNLPVSGWHRDFDGPHKSQQYDVLTLGLAGGFAGSCWQYQHTCWCRAPSLISFGRCATASERFSDAGREIGRLRIRRFDSSNLTILLASIILNSWCFRFVFWKNFLVRKAFVNKNPRTPDTCRWVALVVFQTSSKPHDPVR